MFTPGALDRTGTLTLEDGQSIYWEEGGSPGEVPVLYLHGGPGGTLGTSRYTQFFDLARYRIIGMEQRGCGRSTPLVGDPAHDLDANTMQRLVADCEVLREHLGVTRWVVAGVSWGSTLALAYALTHPDRTLAVSLMAVTTTGRPEVDWITEEMGRVFPEGWDRLASHAEAADPTYRRGEARVVETYARLLRDPDPHVRDAASRAWADWEETHVAIGAGGLHHDPRFDDDTFREVFATLVTHYWAHDGFMDPPILGRVDEIAHLPAVFVQGRRDVSGQMLVPWTLHQRWPGSRLHVDEGDGHVGSGMAEVWAAEHSRLADELGG